MLELIGDFSITKIKEAIRDAETGLIQYKEIMSLFRNTNVSKDISFQRKFKYFYKVNRRNDKFYKAYFSFLELNKSSNPIFSDTLKHFYKIGKSGKNGELVYSLEFSFVSKLLATLNPDLPVWDSNVFICLGLRNPGNWLPKEKRIEKAKEIYNKLIEWYKCFLKSEKGCNWIKLFNEKYPDSDITPVKKIDFILWQRGARIKNNEN